MSLIVMMILGITACNAPSNQEINNLPLNKHVANFQALLPGDMAYLAKHIPHNIPHDLNMADDAQYRLMLHNLRVAGDDPEKSPALYNFLRKQRKNTSQALPIMAAWVSPKTNVAKDSSTLSDINLLSAFYSKDQKTYTAVGTSSIYGGTESTTMQFTFHTEGNAPFHVSPVYKAFGSQTENWVQSTSATIPDDQKGKDVVASVLIIPTSSRLSPGGPITMTSKTLLNATDQCVTAPNYGVHQNAIKLSCPSLTKPTCINKGNVSNPIVSCYARNDTQTGECGDCNYSYGGGAHPDSLALMVSGTITFPDTITTDALGRPQGQLLMYLQQTAADGGCILESHFNKAGTLPKFVSINPENAKQLIYCFKGGDFTSGDCFKKMVRSKVDFNLMVSVQLDIPGGESNFAQAKVASKMCDDVGEVWCAKVPEICIVQGCLAKGTMITLADGSKKAVEDFVGGEIVKSSGQNRRVGATTSGNEWIPMYKIKTENNKEIFISSKHAVPVIQGMKLVKDLTVGDILTTDQGASKIASISKEMYNDTVHNFMVGDKGDAANGVANMYANGILVGDLASQQYYTEKRQERPLTLEDLKKEISPEWYPDLINYMKDK